MKKVIYKFPIVDITIDNYLSLPKGASILTIQLQGVTPMMWMLVDPDAKIEQRRFRVVGTGHQTIEDNMVYIGTWQDAPYVWHLFEIT